jgi:hypothetical protein
MRGTNQSYITAKSDHSELGNFQLTIKDIPIRWFDRVFPAAIMSSDEALS